MVFKFQKPYFWSFELLGSPKRDPVRFGFLKTRGPRVKFRVGFGPDPALGALHLYTIGKSELMTLALAPACRHSSHVGMLRNNHLGKTLPYCS